MLRGGCDQVRFFVLHFAYTLTLVGAQAAPGKHLAMHTGIMIRVILNLLRSDLIIRKHHFQILAVIHLRNRVVK